MSEKQHILSGVVAIIARPDGRVVASVVDCAKGGPLNLPESDAQTIRAQRALADATVSALCSSDVADVLRGYGANEVMEGLVQTKGYRITVLPIGGEPA